MAEDSEAVVKDDKEEAPHQDFESQINTAMRSRIAHFKEQSDSLTFEGVRRLLEEDLGLETFALDVHKRFIKQLLHELLECANDGIDSKNEESEEKRDNVEAGGKGEAREEQAESSEGHQQNSPVLGLLTGDKTTKPEAKDSKGVDKKKALTKGTIKSALRKRARYLRDKSEQLTLAGLRRLLEEDLELEMYSLDPYKKFISDQVDEVLNSPEVSRPVSSAKKNSPRKVAKKVSNEESSDSFEENSDDDDDDERQIKPRKKIVRKGKDNNEPKKRKKPTKDNNISGKKKRIKATETLREANSDADDNGNVSEDGDSQSSAEKSTKKKVVSTPAYGKRVEQLKTVIKACGMSVPPSVYKRVKQAPENKRESHLIKELEEILSKEGLSATSSEKEIKEVRKKKERAKELEGIDTSNIVSSTRRRSTTSFVAPPEPKVPIESYSESTDDEDDDDDDENNEDEDEDDDNGNDSQSEESNADDDENSD